jgi:hypothetical protein
MPGIRAIAFAAAIALASIAARAEQVHAVAPSALQPAIAVYVDAIVQDRAAALACAKSDSAARDDAAWGRARSVFVATLWANGFAPDFIKAMSARLDAPVIPAKAACTDESVESDLGFVEKSGWEKEIARLFSGLDIPVIPIAVTPSQWQAVRNAIEADLPAQKRMLECIAVTYPSMMPVTVHDWDEMLAKLGAKLVAAGLPHDEIGAVIAQAEANALWHRAEPAAVAALRTSCANDGAWSRRLFNFEFASLGADIAKLLPATPEDSN